MTAYYEGFDNNVDLRRSVPSYGARQKPDMEKFPLIDCTLEDDNLLHSNKTPVDINSRALGHISPLSPTVLTGNNPMNAKGQESTVSGSMEKSEGRTPPAAPVKPSALCTVSINDTETVLQGRQKDLSGIHERCQELSGAERPVPDLPNLVGKKSRSARATINLRRSLAWDKAFSTGAGVLDIDELPLVTKTPRKPQELHSFHILETLGKLPPSPSSVPESYTPSPSAVDGEERITSNPGPIHPDCPPCDLQNSPTFESASSKGCSPSVAPSEMDTKPSKSGGKSSVSVGETKADALKGSRLRLPSSFTGKKGKSEALPKPVSLPQNNFLQRCKSASSVLSPTSASAALSKKVSSVSKKVKDTFGKVLPGSLGGSAKHYKVNGDRPLHQGQAANSLGVKSSARSKSSKSFFSEKSLDANLTRKNDGPGEVSNQEVIPAGQLGNGSLKSASVGKDDGPSSKKGTDKKSAHYTQASPVISRKKSDPPGSQVPRTKNSNHVNATQNSKGVSSGLRLPSPKIGFFDTHLRPASGQPASTMPEGVSGAASNNSKYSRKGLPPRPQHGLPSGRAGKPCADTNIAKVASQPASSGIPSAPHLKPFGELAEGLVSSVSVPTSPRMDHLGALSATTHQAIAGRQPSAQLNSDEFRQEFDRVDRTQLTTVPEFGMRCGNEIFEMPVAHPATEAAIGSMDCHPGMANLEIGRSLGHDSRFRNDDEIEDSSKFHEGESSVKAGVYSFAEGKFVFEDSAKAAGNQELPSEDFKNIPGLGKRKAIARWVEDWGHPEKDYMERDNDTFSDCTSLLSNSAVSKPSSRASPGEEHTPSVTPAFKRLSYTKPFTVENIPQNTPDSLERNSSPTFASDSEGSKHPLGVNVGLLNGISKRALLTPSTKERNFQVVLDQPAFEETCGQENRSGSDGQLASTHVNKPQQRKSRSESSHSPFQSEAYRDLFSEERLRALEAGGEETLLKKSGAVQHSPPNKISPNRNPWSPVKRNGQQLGPFDCTKKYTNAFTGQ